MAHCEWVAHPDGSVSVLRLIGTRRQHRCATCGKPANRLCDKALEKPEFGKPAETCSAPMCEEHRTKDGPRDFCPRHA